MNAASLATQWQKTAWGGWLFAGFSVVVALGAALQAFRKFDDRADRHDTLRADFASIRREIEAELCLPRPLRKEPRVVLTEIRTKLDKLAHENTPVPELIWWRAMAERKRHGTALMLDKKQ